MHEHPRKFPWMLPDSTATLLGYLVQDPLGSTFSKAREIEFS